jgi:hypothetical protein
MRGGILLGVLGAIVGCQGKPSESPGVPPPSGEITPLEAPGLHNVFRVSGRVFSGSSPEGDAAFASLRQLGVKTVISVDGAKPDADRAARHGLRYVHLPFGYDGIPRDRVLALAKAARCLPDPFYVHCHHGKHRGPAAVAAILLCTDPSWDVDRAEGWLRTAGTDPRYTGLMGFPRSLARPTEDELGRVPPDFPTAATVPDLARVMVAVDDRWDHLKLVKAAGWVAPKDHPDIDPPHEAVQLAEHYREAARLTDVRGRGPDFDTLLGDAEAAAVELEQSLRANPVDAGQASRAFTRSATACAACHDRFRDRPGVR